MYSARDRQYLLEKIVEAALLSLTGVSKSKNAASQKERNYQREKKVSNGCKSAHIKS